MKKCLLRPDLQETESIIRVVNSIVKNEIPKTGEEK